jgi:hypothetical protein
MKVRLTYLLKIVVSSQFFSFVCPVVCLLTYYIFIKKDI